MDHYPLTDCFNFLRLYIYIVLTSSSSWHLAALISAANMSPLSLCSLEGHVVIGTDTTVCGNGKSSEVFTTWTYMAVQSIHVILFTVNTFLRQKQWHELDSKSFLPTTLKCWSQSFNGGPGMVGRSPSQPLAQHLSEVASKSFWNKQWCSLYNSEFMVQKP